MGSGSQIFASYMALREGWFADTETQEVEKLDFKGGSWLVSPFTVTNWLMSSWAG